MERHFRGESLEKQDEQLHSAKSIQAFTKSGINRRLVEAQKRREDLVDGSAFHRPAVVVAGEQMVSDRHDARSGFTQALSRITAVRAARAMQLQLAQEQSRSGWTPGLFFRCLAF